MTREELIEAGARLIDPRAFRSWQKMDDYCRAHGDDAATATDYADTAEGPLCDKARDAMRAALAAIEAAGLCLIANDDGSAAEVKAVAKTMRRIYDDPIARGSGLICTKMLKRAMIAAGRV